jgi:Ca-activated chloride channel family protein
MSVEFAHREAFWTILVLPVVLGFILWGLRQRKAILKQLGAIDLIAQFSRLPLHRRILYQRLSTIFCLVLLIAVLARPVLFGTSRQLREGTLDVVAVLDVSKSMAAEDCGPDVSRLDRAKDVLLRCFPELASNRLGIIKFAGTSFIQADLTGDFQALRFVVQNWVTVDSTPFPGSSIGNALSEAVQVFDKPDRKRIVLLFSDGGHVRPKNLEGILTDIGAEGITVISVGFGSPMGSRIPVYEDGKFKEWFKIEDKEIITRLDEEILRKISRDTGGKYIRLTSGKRFEGIFKDPSVVGKKALSGGREIFQVPLALSIVLLFLGMYFDRWSS